MDIEAIEKLTTGDRVFATTSAAMGHSLKNVDISLITPEEVVEVIFLRHGAGRTTVAFADAGDVFDTIPEYVFLSREDARNAVVNAIDAKTADFASLRHQWKRDTSEKAG